MTQSNEASAAGHTRRDFLQYGAASAAALALGPGAVAAAPGASVEQIQPKARAFPLRQVSLLDGPFKQARELDRRYLLAIPNERMLHCFRLTAGLPSSAEPLGGWESPHCELRGHFCGHYLSACALLYGATGDEAIRAKAEAFVAGLAQCQQADGYLGAYPASFYDRLARGENVWVPIYTYHKLVAGLLDMHTHCGSVQALQMATRMADWLGAWMRPFDEAQWARILEVEFGGINEVLLNLYAATGNSQYRDDAARFDQKSFFEPLAAQRDELAKLHANTGIPKVVGAARAYELTADERYRGIAEYFWRIVTADHAWATGGTSSYELWGKPGQFAGQLGGHTQECCCSYNMLKLTRHLYGWKPDPALMDYYERVLFNARLGTQDDKGMMMYFVPLDAGYWKLFNKPYDSFWCCTGTGVEEFAKTSDSIYFHDGDQLYVNLYIASELSWPEQGLRITQQTRFPEEEGTTLLFKTRRPREIALNLRVPYWATQGATLKLNGKVEQIDAVPGSYLTLRRRFRDGDRIELSLPMALHAAPLADDNGIQAMMYGPLVLAARLGTEGMDAAKINVADQRPSFNRIVGRQLPSMYFEPDQTWIKRSDTAPLRFEGLSIEGPLQFVPFYQVRDERYAVYCRVRPVWERNPQI